MLILPCHPLPSIPAQRERRSQVSGAEQARQAGQTNLGGRWATRKTLKFSILCPGLNERFLLLELTFGLVRDVALCGTLFWIITLLLKLAPESDKNPPGNANPVARFFGRENRFPRLPLSSHQSGFSFLMAAWHVLSAAYKIRRQVSDRDPCQSKQGLASPWEKPPPAAWAPGGAKAFTAR